MIIFLFSFVLQHLSSDSRKDLYKKLIVKAIIQNNPQMTICPGLCDRIFEAIDKPIPGKVECELCGLKFW
jgi:hypothetical protein